MTLEVEQTDLATSWQEYFEIYYRDDVSAGFLKSIKRAENEGIADLNCIVIKLKLTLDFTILINHNPDFYEYFSNATPEELKGLIRESSVPIIQKLMRNVNEEIVISKRQISIDLSVKNVPIVCESMIACSEFYKCAIPKLTCTENNSDLKGIWDSRPYILEGRVVGISEKISIPDVMTYSCTNPRCRNSAHVIRIVGFDDLENADDLGPDNVKPEVFVSMGSRSTKVIKCYNCREEVNEIYPFRSSIDFMMTKIQTKDSIFTIDALIVGSETCEKVKMSSHLVLTGYPKLCAEIPSKLTAFSKIMKPYYFEVYGVDSADQVSGKPFDLTKALNALVDATGEFLRFPLLLLILQLIGSLNSIHFNVSFPGIDQRILERIANLFNYCFSNDMAVGKMNASTPKAKSSKSAQINITHQKYPYLLNIVESVPKDSSDTASLIQSKYIDSESFTCIVVDLTDEQESDFMINNHSFKDQIDKFELPIINSEVRISGSAVKTLNEYFLNLRQTGGNFPMKQTISLLTKLTKISAILRNFLEADLYDAEFATMIFSQLKSIKIDDNNSTINSQQNMPLSPSVSFEISPNLDNNWKFL